MKLYNFTSSNTIISSFDYQYDNVGNRNTVVESNGDRVTWIHDNTYQLSNEKRSGASAYNTTFTYDAVGNRLVKEADGVLTTSMYDAANQFQTSQDTSGTTTYTFDADGNQQVVEEPSGTLTTNTWDFENRNIKVEIPSGTVNTFTFNPDAQRVQKQDSSGTSKFVWDKQRYLLETNASDATQVVYTNEPLQYGNLVSQRRDSTTSYYHSNGVGSTRELTSANQTITDTWLYDSFGDENARTGTTANPFRYVGLLGYYFDADTATYYVRARIYDPGIGRWLSQDPLFYPMVKYYGGWPGRPSIRDPIKYERSQRNLYDYASCNPMARLDPSGELDWNYCCRCYFHYLTNPWEMDRDLEVCFYASSATAVIAGGAAIGVCAAGGTAGGAIAALGIGTRAVVARGLGAGTWPALMIGGRVYVARFHDIAWRMGGSRRVQKWGFVIIDETGKVIGWLE